MASSFIAKAFGIPVYHLDPQACLAIVSSKTHIAHAFGIRVSTFKVYGNISAKLNSKRCFESLKLTVVLESRLPAFSLWVRGYAWSAHALQRLQQHGAACGRLSVNNAGSANAAAHISRCWYTLKKPCKNRLIKSAGRCIGRSLFVNNLKCICDHIITKIFKFQQIATALVSSSVILSEQM